MTIIGNQIDPLFDGTIEPGFFIDKIQNILNKEHTNCTEKKKLVPYPKTNPKRLNFACPYCGDSEKVRTKKRGNLYLNTLIYRCFNCGHEGNFTKLCNDFNQIIDPEDKLKIYSYVDSRSFTKGDEYQLESLNKLLSLESWVKFMNEKPESWLAEIKPIQKNSHVYQYLTIDRLIFNHENIYQGIYQKFRDGKRIFYTKVIILLNRCGDKLLGVQLRNLEKDREKRFFKIVDFEELYNYMNPDNTLDEMEAIPYNKLSHFFNIMNVDFNKPVSIFEGYLDSTFCPNSIGMVGANNDEDLLDFLTNADEHLDLRFFYDYDKTGLEKSIKMIEKGFPVFLWKKLFDTLINKSKDKYKSKKFLNNIVDLNQLIIKLKDPNIYHKFKLDNFYSIDEFDSIYLPVN